MDHGIEVVRLPHLLSADECRNLLRRAEGQYDRGPFAGDRERAILMDDRLASLVWQRIARHFQPREHGPDQGGHCEPIPAGRYEPIGVNPMFRLSKYSPGGSFRMHTDSCYVRDDQYVGMHTLLIYLNEDMVGGTTAIYDEDLEVVCDVVPKTGDGLAFYHLTIHEGRPVREGFKYIARTEIMYRRAGP